MYGNNKQCQIKESGREERGRRQGFIRLDSLCENIPPSLRPHKDEFGRPLGIYTKSLVAPSKRVHDFILQDQSCKLLPKHRVCNCLKKRIDKNKNRTVKYNVDRKNLTGRMSNAVHLYGFVLFVLNKLQRADVQSFLLLLNVGKRNF